jgi:hypothetical protein
MLTRMMLPPYVVPHAAGLPPTRSSRRSGRAWWSLIPVLWTAVPGCAFGYRVLGGPSVDTAGTAGMLVQPGMAFGLKTDDTQGIVLLLQGGVGTSLTSEHGVVSAVGGFDWVDQEVVDDVFALRVGFRGRYLGLFSCDGWTHQTGAVGAALGFLFPVDDEYHAGHEKLGGGGHNFWNLGFELEVDYAAIAADDPEEPGTHAALFLLQFVYEFNGFADLF